MIIHTKYTGWRRESDSTTHGQARRQAYIVAEARKKAEREAEEAGLLEEAQHSWAALAMVVRVI